MKSARFGKEVIITSHARARMAERGIGDDVLRDLIENGQLTKRGPVHYLIFRRYLEREDNLLCAAVADEEVLVVKTVMINWSLRERP